MLPSARHIQADLAVTASHHLCHPCHMATTGAPVHLIMVHDNPPNFTCSLVAGVSRISVKVSPGWNRMTSTIKRFVLKGDSGDIRTLAPVPLPLEGTSAGAEQTPPPRVPLGRPNTGTRSPRTTPAAMTEWALRSGSRRCKFISASH